MAIPAHADRPSAGSAGRPPRVTGAPASPARSLPDVAQLRVVAPLLRGRLGECGAPGAFALGEPQLGRAEPAAPGGGERLGALLAAAEVVGNRVPRGHEVAAAAPGVAAGSAQRR